MSSDYFTSNTSQPKNMPIPTIHKSINFLFQPAHEAREVLLHGLHKKPKIGKLSGECKSLTGNAALIGDKRCFLTSHIPVSEIIWIPLITYIIAIGLFSPRWARTELYFDVSLLWLAYQPTFGVGWMRDRCWPAVARCPATNQCWLNVVPVDQCGTWS